MNPNGAAPGHGHEGPREGHFGDASRSTTSSSRELNGDLVTPPHVAQTSHSSDALTMEFYKRFHPAVAECRDFALKSNAFAPTAPSLPSVLSELLKDPSNRSCAWRFIGTEGIDDAFSVPERRALCAGLLSYVHQDKDESVIPLIEIALYAAERRDMELYKAVGEVALSAGLGDSIADSTVMGFCGLQSYNAMYQSEFHPWMEIFARSNSLPVYERISNTLEERVNARQAGTYDHLLRTLCIADSSRAATVLHTLIAVPLPPNTDTLPKPNSWKIALRAFTPLCLGMLATQSGMEAALALAYSEGIATAVTTSLGTPRPWIISGALGGIWAMTAVLTAWIARDEAATVCDAKRARLLGPDHHHLAERVYARLGEAAPRNRYAHVVRYHMELCDAYTSVMDGWRQSYPLAAAPNNSESA